MKQVPEAMVFGLDCLFESPRELVNGVMPKSSLRVTELDSLGMGSSSPYSCKSSPGDSNVQPGLKTPAS